MYHRRWIPTTDPIFGGKTSRQHEFPSKLQDKHKQSGKHNNAFRVTSNYHQKMADVQMLCELFAGVQEITTGSGWICAEVASEVA